MQQILVEITEEQKGKIRPFIPDIDKWITGSLHSFLSELNDAIVAELGKDYEDTPNSMMLQDLYDEIRIASHKKYDKSTLPN